MNNPDENYIKNWKNLLDKKSQNCSKVTHKEINQKVNKFLSGKNKKSKWNCKQHLDKRENSRKVRSQWNAENKSKESITQNCKARVRPQGNSTSNWASSSQFQTWES